MANHKDRYKRYLDNLQARLFAQFGGKCVVRACTVFVDLQFAHIEPTGLHGRGRGRRSRLLDVRRHPESYALMCKLHHDLFDGRQPAEVKQ
jgi:hypothetical protein